MQIARVWVPHARTHPFFFIFCSIVIITAMGNSDLDRFVGSQHVLTLRVSSELFELIKRINFCRQIEKIRNCELITEGEVRRLCAKAYEILIEESNVQRVDAPVTVNSVKCIFLFLWFVMPYVYALICSDVCRL